MLTLPAHDVTFDLLTADPATALGRLADYLDRLHRQMAPADILELDLHGECLAMGRHEVPGLALLFRNHAVAPDAERDALARGQAFLRSARIRSGA